MANDINSVNITGRLVRDAELKYTGGGTPVLNFAVAVNKSVKRNDQWQDEGHFFDCVLWGKLGEAVNQYMKKGIQVAVDGELQQDRWEKDGQKHSKVKIRVNNLRMMGGNSSGQANNQSSSGNYSGPSSNYNGPGGTDPQSFEDDIPF